MDTHFNGFLNNFFRTPDYRIYPLAGDASNRRYYRIIIDNQSWVLMVWDPFEPKDYPFLSVQAHFAKNGIRVPEVVTLSPEEGLVLLEDLGDLTLERRFWESQSPELSLPFYKKALDELVKIHFEASNDQSPCTAFHIQFDTEKFLWEMNYGLENLIKGICRYSLNSSVSNEITDIFRHICETLHHEPKWIAHRDFHSRNLMIKLDEVRVIDFQDARMGPVQYDLVSLLKDSYVQMRDEMAESLLQYYLDQARTFLGKNFSRAHFNEIYELQSIQRCFKACGSFSSFYIQRNDTRYLKYISHTLRRVVKSLQHFPKYKMFGEILKDSGAMERQFEVL